MDLITWTTPLVQVQVEDYDLSDYDCTITAEQRLRSGSVVASVTVDAECTYDGTDSYVSQTFTQEQTGRFREGIVEFMVNGINDEGDRQATEPIMVRVGRNLYEQEVTYGA